MELKDILAVAGHSGLFKYIAQSSNGVIVESLLDGTRTKMAATARISSLTEIAVFTDREELPLSKLFDLLFAHTDGRETISPKSTPDQMKALFTKVLPDYDRDRVHVSDMKKVIAWFNILVAAGMTKFTSDDSEEKEEKSEEEKL